MRHQVLFTPEQIGEQVRQLAMNLDRPEVDSYLVLTVLKGAAIFSSDLVRAMRTDTQLEYISATSYAEDFTPGESVTITNVSNPEVGGRDVLVVEDIIDTGKTLERLHGIVAAQQPASVTAVALVNKTGRRDSGYLPDHTGFDITDEFIYGYGLDWNQRYRGLPCIAIANPATTGGSIG